MVDSGQAYLRVEKATRAALIVDADEYFEAARAAMLKAKRRIILVGWDFDARISLSRRLMPSEPKTLGEFVLWLAERTPDLEVLLLR